MTTCTNIQITGTLRKLAKQLNYILTTVDYWIDTSSDVDSVGTIIRGPSGLGNQVFSLNPDAHEYFASFATEEYCRVRVPRETFDNLASLIVLTSTNTQLKSCPGKIV